MSELENFARRELASLVKPDDDGTQIAINRDIMELISTFANQGYSGSTAPYAAALFGRLVLYKPLGPLTGDADEWTIIAEEDGAPVYQNKRRSSVFKNGEHGQPYDIDGRVFRDPDGATWTGSDSRVDITFPYTVPDAPEIVDRPWQWPDDQRFNVGILYMEGNITSDDKPFTVGLLRPAGGNAWTKDFPTFYEGSDYFDRKLRDMTETYGEPVPVAKTLVDGQPQKSLLREATAPDDTKPAPPPGTRYKPEGFA